MEREKKNQYVSKKKKQTSKTNQKMAEKTLAIKIIGKARRAEACIISI